MAAFDRVPAEDWEQLGHVLDAGVDDLSGDAQALAVQRASRRLGVDDLDVHEDEHLRALWDELRAIVLRASLERLAAKGELRIAGVARDGQLVYERADRLPAEAPEDSAPAGPPGI